MENFKGRHLILNLYDVDLKYLDNIETISKILRDAALKANATILNENYHHFGEGYGVTGVISLAESHISSHSWPEDNYAAIDIFMCGNCDPFISMEYILHEMECFNYNHQLIYRK